MLKTGLKCLLICISTFLGAQNSRIDSLKQALSGTNRLETQVELYHQLAYEFWDYDFETGHSYARQGLELANRADYQEGEVKTLTDVGQYYYFTGDYIRARQYFNEALREAGDKNFGDFPSYTLTRLGNLFRVQAGFDSAKYYYDKAITLTEGNERVYWIAHSSALYNMGLLYNEFSYFKRALPLLERAYDLRANHADSLLMAEAMKGLATAYIGLGNFEKAWFNLKATERIASQFNDPELRMFYCLSAGEASFIQGNFEVALDFYEQALEVLKTHDFIRNRAVALYLIGEVHRDQGDYDNALDHYYQAARIFEDLRDRINLARTYQEIAWVYRFLGDFKLSYEYANMALTIQRTIHDYKGEGEAYNVLALTLYSQKRYDQALMYHDLAYEQQVKMDDRIGMAATQFNKAMSYEEQNQLQKALDLHNEALKLDEESGNRIGLAISYNFIGRVLTKMRKFNQAYAHLEKARALSVEIGSTLQLRNYYLYYSRLLAAEGDARRANQAYEKYIALNDSIFNDQTVQKSTRLNALYNLERKEKEIESLQKERELQKSALEVQGAKLRQQQVVLYSAVIGLVLISIVAYVIYTYYKRVAALNMEIAEKKEEIQAQAEELIEANETIANINKKLEAKVEDRTRKLKQAYHELDTFFYRSSHDFRRPLTTFMGLAEVAKITVKDTNALELFDKVRETALGLDKMLVKLQSVSDVGAQELSFKEVLMNDIFLNVIEEARDKLSERNIRTRSQVEIDVPFYSYPALIKTITENLLENAIIFSPPESGQIELNARLNGNAFIILEVKDNGIGMAPEIRSKIFDMYFRGSDRSKGNGLGLFIVKKAVEKLNGQIEVESAPGLGSLFRIVLPNQSPTVT